MIHKTILVLLFCLGAALAVPVEPKEEAQPAPVAEEVKPKPQEEPVLKKEGSIDRKDVIEESGALDSAYAEAPEGKLEEKDLEGANTFWGSYGGWGYRTPYYGGWGRGYGGYGGYGSGWGGYGGWSRGWGGYGGYGGYGRGYRGYGGYRGGWGSGYGGWSW